MHQHKYPQEKVKTNSVSSTNTELKGNNFPDESYSEIENDHCKNCQQEIPANVTTEISFALIKFKADRCDFYCVQNGLTININDYVIVDADRGCDIGMVVSTGNLAFLKLQSKKGNCGDLKKIIRKANEGDLQQLQENRAKEDETFKVAVEKISKHQLSMRLVDVEYQFDLNRMTFYYTAEHRIDFRELVKDLAFVYHTRIEMRQIGVRDETKRVGGIGVCGRQICCTIWLNDFERISSQHVAQQGLSHNPLKLSGQCSRLKCCLVFELDNYSNNKSNDERL